jgi:quercetin dioxygenase-like cupin family protein
MRGLTGQGDTRDNRLNEKEVEVLRARRLRKKWSVAVVGVAAIGTFATVALGSLGVGFTPTNLVTGSLTNKVEANSDQVKLQTEGATDVRVQKIVFNAGGTSGWHHHPGVVIATVASGAVTFTRNCSATTYGPGLSAGSVFVESGDSPGQASSVDGATVFVTFVAPHADPPVFRIEDSPPAACPAGGTGDDHSGGHNGDGGRR